MKTSPKKQEIRFKINGQVVTQQINPSLFLIDLIRGEMGLTGTKPGCLEGECGACTVLINGRSVNSCLYLAVNVDGKEVTTIEGVSHGDPVVSAMVNHGGVQCGFCSPGMVMSIKGLQNRCKGHADKDGIKKGLEGNLCRCTGYAKIVEAAHAVMGGDGSK